jgi:tetratricopeptide (TPR) repeat protein/O-antigen ligase
LIDVEKAVRRGLFLLLFLTPFLFGTVEFWSLAVMEVACIALALVWLFRLLSAETPFRVIEPPFLVPLGLLLGFAMMQVVPMPPVVIKLLSPQTYRVYSENLPSSGLLPWLTLSLYPYATLLEIVRFIGYVCIYCLTIQVLTDRKSITRMTTVILVIGTCIALLGIFQRIFWNGKLLWFRELSEGCKPFGPYANRNHFAGLMEMLIPVSVGALIYLLPGLRGDHDIKGAVSDFFSHRRANRAVLTGTAVVIMITSLFLSLSRGGIIGLSLSMLFLGVMLWTRESTRQKGRTIVALFLVVLLSVGWFGWKPILAKFEGIRHSDPSTEYRIQNWKDSLKIVRAYPLFGTGLGTYEHIYPHFKTVPTLARWEHAHNDFIEGAVELGVPGLVLALYVVGSFYRKMFAMLKMRRSLSSRLLGMGAMAGVAGIVIHGLTDFNLHVGANGLYFCFLMGYGVAVSHARVREENGGTLLKVREVSVPQHMRRPLFAGIALICVSICAVPVLNAGAEICYSLAKGSLRERSELPSRGEILEKASLLSPLDARMRFAKCTIHYALGEIKEMAGDCSRAVELNPANGEYLQMLGVAYDNAGRGEEAAKYMRLGVLYDQSSPWIRKNYSLWLFSKGQKDAAIGEMRQAIALDPDNTRKYITALVLSRLTPGEVRSAIPENFGALLLYGTYKEEKGDTEDALNAYRDALSVMKREGAMRPEAYYKITALYEKKGLLDQALFFYEEGVRNNPRDYQLRRLLAGLYEKLGIPYRAREEYEKVLSLHPFDEHAQGRIKALRNEGPAGPAVSKPHASP